MMRRITVYFSLFCLIMCALSACVTRDINVSCESVKDTVGVSEHISNSDLFKEKFGYNLDEYDLLDSDSENYKIFIDNPVDIWSNDFRETVRFSYTDISQGEILIWKNWEKNIHLSLSNLKTCISDDNYAIVEEWANNEINLIVKESDVTDAIIRELTFPGTLQFVGILAERNDAIRRIAFKLKFFEILAQEHNKEESISTSEKDLSFVFDENILDNETAENQAN